MSGPVLSPPLSAIDSDELASMLDRLNDDQRRYVVQQLLPSILANVREPRSVTDLDGRVIGYYMPRKSLDGEDLLAASVSDSGSFHFPSPVQSTSASGVLRAKKQKAQDLFEVDLGGSD